MRQKFIRWLIPLLLLCTSHLASSQAIIKMEYFYDADPGAGNGTVINLSPSEVIDSTFSFNVSSLNNGLHLLFVRVQDTADKWSLAYITSFVKTTGNNGTLAINKLEYFIDVDPGVGNGTSLALSPGGMVDSTISFDVS